ncbi:MAG TPA: methionyl-tRNA formyltransferase [Acidobacteriota bacterium]|nr:methionyl-tRNA formyltransferase [Acidobacteriota bacterium]
MSIRVVFLGTPEFAVPTLRELLADPQVEVTGVVTQPDRPAGRGRKLTPPPVKVLALEHDLPVYQTRSLRKDPQALAWIREHRPDVMVVAAFGQILPPEYFRLPRHGTLNVHASLLPKYRGASPIAKAIMEGEKETGITIMRIAAGLDSGDMLTRCRVPIPQNITRGELEPILAEEGARLLIETLPKWIGGEIDPQPQDDDQATLAPMMKKADGVVDWNESARRVHDHIRALNPWPGGQTFFRGQLLKLWGSRLDAHDFEGVPPQGSRGERARPGQITAVTSGGLSVRCGDGRDLLLTVVQPPNRKRLAAYDFANGFAVHPGEVLGEEEQAS